MLVPVRYGLVVASDRSLGMIDALATFVLLGIVVAVAFAAILAIDRYLPPDAGKLVDDIVWLLICIAAIVLLLRWAGI